MEEPMNAAEARQVVLLANSYGAMLDPFLVSKRWIAKLREASKISGIALSDKVIVHPKMPDFDNTNDYRDLG